MRGGERVLDALARSLPHADLYTLFYRQGTTTPAIDAMRVQTSPLNRLPGVDKHYRKLLPLYPWAAQRLEIKGYDLVLSISHAVAKNVRTEPSVPHLCYCLTPMRYIWDQVDAYLGTGVRRLVAGPLIHALRRHDVAHSDQEGVDRFVTISSTVAERVQRHYGRQSSVIYPPVDCHGIRPSGEDPEDFYLLVGGFVPYKRDALAIEAFRGRSDRLVVVGDGPMRAQLQARAPGNVEFVGRIPDRAMTSLLQRCKALIYPQEEDFGIAAVEAQAAGRPVIALGAGGALDTVRPLCVVRPEGGLEWRDEEPAPTGIYFSEQTPEALNAALDAFALHRHRFDSETIRQQAESFGQARFLAEISSEIEQLTGRPSPILA
ncbi:MAG: glycosyltransferase [Myxococcota bacterium]|jgi:glycosyltransferase involved in cell wall biosynthesis|nr:glycosyltransferase [Myxococcota bacterium]